jgi:DNA-binding MarR family transcriptional regulator
VKRRGGLSEEIKQVKPFHSTAHEAVLGLLRTADLVRRRYAAVLAPSGITSQQYNVLRILRGAGENGLPTLEIAARMIENTPGVTRLVDRLEAAKLVVRERSKEDRRTVTCRATKKALELLAGLDDAVDAADDAALAMLSETSKRSLIRILDAVRARSR